MCGASAERWSRRVWRAEEPSQTEQRNVFFPMRARPRYKLLQNENGESEKEQRRSDNERKSRRSNLEKGTLAPLGSSRFGQEAGGDRVRASVDEKTEEESSMGLESIRSFDGVASCSNLGPTECPGGGERTTIFAELKLRGWGHTVSETSFLILEPLIPGNIRKRNSCCIYNRFSEFPATISS